MADYNLSGLSTRSFEQLIQAIAVKVFGPNIVIFGDGPDGGREAIFEGTVPYPSKERAWSGYGVVQAKFLQRPQGAPKDGEWALQQLRKELTEFGWTASISRNKKKKSKKDPSEYVRRTPDYYIFVTNAVLTPVGDQGTKDKAQAILAEFKKDLGLKDFDIWDYDKICSYLDGYEDIRHGYDGFITVGDVLAQVIARLQLMQPDFEQVIYRFLQEELIADQYANLEQAGRATEDKVPIARVFVDLPTFDEMIIDPLEESSAQLAPGFVAEVVQTAKNRLDPASVRAHASTQDDLIDTPSNNEGRYVLVGGPGQGKTTISQFICQLFRAAILKGRANWVPVREIADILDLIATQCQGEGIELPTARRFPIRIVLNDFAKELAVPDSGRVTSVLSYITARIRKRTDNEMTPNDLRLWLQKYPWLVIFDGLDEVPASSNRDQVLKEIQRFRIEVNDSNADVLIIGTTRPQGYGGDFTPDIYSHKWLAPLSVTRALHYARRLTEIRYSADNDRREQVLNRLERAAHTEATARLMRSPLQVTIMTTLVGTRGQPPQERWSLFSEYYKVIYQREMEREIPASDILRAYKSDIDRIHNRVGLILQAKSERSGETDARLSKQDFAVVVSDRLDEEEHEGPKRDELERQIIEAATDRLVFLVGLQDDQIGFEIRSLQEFMSAEALMDEREEIVRRRLCEIAPVSNWRNVFLFAAGKCFAERQDLRDTIYRICAELNDSATDEVSSATLEGSQLAMDLLEEGIVRTQPKFARLFTRLAFHSLSLNPAPAQVRLAKLYDEASASLYRDELIQRLELTDFYRQLGAWKCLAKLIAADIDWARVLGDYYWPEDDVQKLEVLRVIAEIRDESWKLSKLIELVPRLPPNRFSLLRERDIEDHFIFQSLDTESAPEWLQAVVSVAIKQLSVTTPLKAAIKPFNNTEEVLSLTVYKTIDAIRDDMASLADMPGEIHAGWKPVAAGIRFKTDPTRETLIRELRGLAAISDFEVVKNNSYNLPWVLAACIESSNCGPDLELLADHIENGELGNETDWAAAEKRWLEDGIRNNDIEYTLNERLPFDKHIAKQGFPFSVANKWSFTIQNPLDQALQLVKLHEELAPSRVKSLLAGWTLFILTSIFRRNQNPSNIKSALLTREQLQNLINDATFNKIRTHLTALSAYDWSSGLDESWVETLDNLGRNGRLTASAGPDNKLIDALTTAFIKDPHRIGLLRLLSLVVLEGGTSTVPIELLNPERYDDPRTRASVIVIRMTQKRITVEEAELLAMHAAKVAEDETWSADAPLYLVEHNRLPFDHSLDKFLVTLLKQLPTTRWRTAQKTTQALIASLKRRTSGLEKSELWTNLGFRQKLISLVRGDGYPGNIETSQ